MCPIVQLVFAVSVLVEAWIVEWVGVVAEDSLAFVEAAPGARVDTVIVLAAGAFVVADVNTAAEFVAVAAVDTAAAPSSSGPSADSTRNHPCPQHEPGEFSFPSFVFDDEPQKLWNLESFAAIDGVRYWVAGTRRMDIVEYWKLDSAVK